MAKKIKSKVRLQIMAAQANPAPPIGPALAQHGINIAEFCKQFNDATKSMAGYTIPADITVYEDRSFSFVLRQPLLADLIKKAAGVQKGSDKPNKNKVGKITKDQAREIAEKKLPDFNTKNIEQAVKIVEGQARSMGIEVK
ncbi:MAG: 50S ribosomal protein L11 [Candidatus Paceibacterota bacterium]|jgi:large subunit ribosomal protein L11|nr:50S ribosomal protein L11 [Candidatus Paceibacterota bacterium]MDD5621234.1 50S ribosomal protein L11 [Candidatus Paceibacterota bacterium]